MLGDASVRRCRFCERTSRHTRFADPRPIVPDRHSPMTAEVCDDCRLDWLEPLDDEFRRFWERLRIDAPSAPDGALDRRRSPLTVAAYKSLVAGALAIVPGAELPYFVNTLEWLSNTDHDLDDRLLGGAECRVYRASFLHDRAGLSLVGRVDDEAPVPYMLYYLACDGIMVQVPLPMCLRDEDLDGRTIEQPERVLSAGIRPRFPRGSRRPSSAGRVGPAGEPGPAIRLDRQLRSPCPPPPPARQEADRRRGRGLMECPAPRLAASS